MQGFEFSCKNHNQETVLPLGSLGIRQILLFFLSDNGVPLLYLLSCSVLITATKIQHFKWFCICCMYDLNSGAYVQNICHASTLCGMSKTGITTGSHEVNLAKVKHFRFVPYSYTDLVKYEIWGSFGTGLQGTWSNCITVAHCFSAFPHRAENFGG